MVTQEEKSEDYNKCPYKISWQSIQMFWRYFSLNQGGGLTGRSPQSHADSMVKKKVKFSWKIILIIYLQNLEFRKKKTNQNKQKKEYKWPEEAFRPRNSPHLDAPFKIQRDRNELCMKSVISLVGNHHETYVNGALEVEKGVFTHKTHI